MEQSQSIYDGFRNKLNVPIIEKHNERVLDVINVIEK